MTHDGDPPHPQSAGPQKAAQPAPLALSAEQLRAQLPTGWQGDEHGIWREFAFEHYLDGVRFAERVGQQAQHANHHPDILISYGKVRVSYTTHDANGGAGGVTALDLEEAASIIELK